jgi:hypothetical protein
VNWNLGLFSTLSWTWHALRGHSVTFAVLFALTLLGVPVLSEFRHLLGRWGATWYVWLLVPILVVGYCAKKETQWIPELPVRKRWARSIFFGSIVLAFVLAKARSRPDEHETATTPPAVVQPR